MVEDNNTPNGGVDISKKADSSRTTSVSVNMQKKPDDAPKLKTANPKEGSTSDTVKKTAISLKGAAKKTQEQQGQEKPKFRFKSGGLGDTTSTATPKANKSAMASSLSTVVTRNEYYRDGFRNLLKIAIIEGVIIALMICSFIFYMYVSKPQDRYFATTADGRIMRLVPLGQPNMTRAALLSWVSQAATDVMTFGFHDYRQRLQSASQHFTRRGWESFTGALQRSRIITSVENAQQVLTAVPRSAPVLLQEGVFNGKYRWIVELPLMVTYQSGNKARTDNITITITIERVPTLESTNGVGIEQWIAL